MTACTPNLPALITALPGDHTRAPQTEFTRERQVAFLENLSLTGSVRSAAAAAGVSHQTAYRARRGIGAFRLAWDAALVTARANAEVVLAARAIDGIEEKVFYHGEEVATRTRYSDRLLLAHLGRLDRLTADARVNAVAEDFDAALARFAADGDPLPATPAAGVENLSPEPCNTRSMSPARHLDGREHWEEWDDSAVEWEDEAAADAELLRVEAAMEAARPAGAPRLDTDDPNGLIEDAQHQAFLRGVPRWWLVVPPAPPFGSDAWCYADVEDPAEHDVREDDGDGAAPELDGADADNGASADDAPEEEAAPDNETESIPEHGPEPEPAAAPVNLARGWQPAVHGRLVA